MSLIGLFASPSQSDPLSLRRLESKIDLILDRLGIEYEPFTPEIRAAADAGLKIEAIRMYREATGAGLAEAKADVEDYMRTSGKA